MTEIAALPYSATARVASASISRATRRRALTPPASPGTLTVGANGLHQVVVQVKLPLLAGQTHAGIDVVDAVLHHELLGYEIDS